MKIFITGAGGQLGTDCQRVLKKNHELAAYSWDMLDIGDFAAVQMALASEKPDVLINCAAYTVVDQCEGEGKEEAWWVNAEGAKYLAMGAAEAGVRFIHISTDYVFDGAKPVPERYLEGDAVNPLSEYGRSKLAGEEAVIESCENSLILRTAWLYSGYGKNFFKTMLRLAADPMRQFKVVNDQYGSPTWSLTLAMQIEALLDSEIRGVVHTTSEGYCTWFEAACYFLSKMGAAFSIAPCTTAEYPTPAHRPANSILENGVLKEAGINRFSDWRVSMDQFVAMHGEQLREDVEKELAGTAG